MTWRALARPATAISATIAILALASAAHAWAGSGGIGDEPVPPNPTDPTDPTNPDDGVFPVVGNHTYGDGFGAGRDHEGQDLLAKCGKAVVSAQSGRVQMVDYHSAAGNYVVIDGQGPLLDLVYAHLQDRPTLRKGQKVFAGEEIGRVGDSGNASTCHLHFEMWANPGYYEGGHAQDPTTALKSWDRAKR